MKKVSPILHTLLERRASFLEAILATVLVALGVNLLSSAIFSATGDSVRTSSSIAVILFLVALGYVLLRYFGMRIQRHELEGVFVYDPKTKRTVALPRYQYSEKLADYLTGAFAENKALETIWNKEPPNREFQRRTIEQNDPPKSLDLVREATEYFVLDRLSTHLTDYFNRDDFSDNTELVTLSREHMPEVLLRNRFLELFSRPMADRPAFVEDTFIDDSVKPVFAYGEGGVIFDRFELTLPKRAKVKRHENTIIIDTARMGLELTAQVDGMNTLIPFGYQEHVLGDSRHEFIIYRVSLGIEIRLRPLALLWPTGWKYYRWAEIFVESLREEFAAEQFFKDINWITVETILEARLGQQPISSDPSKKN